MTITVESKSTITLTPEQVAEAFWYMFDDAQADFFAHLQRISGGMLGIQMRAVLHSISERYENGDADAMHALEEFRFEAARAGIYRIERACSHLKGEIVDMASRAKQDLGAE